MEWAKVKQDVGTSERWSPTLFLLYAQNETARVAESRDASASTNDADSRFPSLNCCQSVYTELLFLPFPGSPCSVSSILLIECGVGKNRGHRIARMSAPRRREGGNCRRVNKEGRKEGICTL